MTLVEGACGNNAQQAFVFLSTLEYSLLEDVKIFLTYGNTALLPYADQATSC